MPKVDPSDVDPRRCTAAGEGVDQAVTGKKCSFTVQGVMGFLNLVDVSISGPSTPPINKSLDESGKDVICSYTPSLPGEYIITVKVKDKELKNSPFKCEVIGDSDPKLLKVALVEVQGKGVIIAKGDHC